MTPPDLPDGFTISPGSRRDWPAFAPYHYVERPLAPLAGLWLAHTAAGEPAAIVAYAFPGMGCTGRQRVLGPSLYRGMLAERLPRLNSAVRVLHRLVVMPHWRGRGIGPALVAATLPMLGVPWIEALAMRPGALMRAGMFDTGPLGDARPHYLLWEHPALLRSVSRLQCSAIVPIPCTCPVSNPHTSTASASSRRSATHRSRPNCSSIGRKPASRS